jgi:CBS domain-containing protein
MSVGEICNRNVAVVEKERSIQEAAELMRKHHVGDLIVVGYDHNRKIPIGIVTDRDIVVELIAKKIPTDAVTVGDVMSYELVTAMEDDDLLQTLKLMRAKGARRLPVVDSSGSLVGILTVDDIIELLAETLSDVSKLIERQQHLEQDIRP